MECWSYGVMLKLEYKKFIFFGNPSFHYSNTPLLHWGASPLDCFHILETLDLFLRITYSLENLHCMFSIFRRRSVDLERILGRLNWISNCPDLSLDRMLNLGHHLAVQNMRMMEDFLKIQNGFAAGICILENFNPFFLCFGSKRFLNFLN
jgi:hypothetical protein